MDAREAFVALNMINHVGPIRMRALLEACGGPVEVLKASRTTLRSVQGVGEETADAIRSWEKQIDLKGELRRAKEFGCRILIGTDSEYPASLREIHDPPIALYLRGALAEADRYAIALVGSRETTPYGRDTAHRLARQLGAAGITVVSGGARGIDTSAHEGALEATGRTVAVLGTGINIVFPPENAALFERITRQGAVLTQFPFNRPADKQSFPIRNRIVAGMTLGTVVVEANASSGALITANFAAEYGRQVFAIPGRIDSPKSRGCHDLIKKGAKLCEGIDDIVSEFEYLLPQAQPVIANSSDQLSLGIGAPGGPTVGSHELKILGALDVEERSIDEIIQISGLPASVVNAGLFSLELKHRVRQLPGKMFHRISRAG